MNNKIKVRINCNNPSYFLKDLIRRNIELFDIKENKKNIEVIIKKEDYLIISQIKTVKKIKILDYYGINKIEYLLKKNSCFFILVALGVLLNIFFSNLILEVDIQTPNKKLEKEIRKDLEKLGIKKYNFKVPFQKKENIKSKLKNSNKNKIEWLEIEEHGTKYIIKVEEKKLNKKEDKCENRNIVAKKNAIITSISSSSGEIVKKKNDYVTKGEIIISGQIHNKENIVNEKCTKGKVLGETWYRVKVEINNKEVQESLTGKKKYGFSIKIFSFEKDFLNKFSTFQKKEYNIIESKILPIKINIVNYQETNKKIHKYTLDNVDKKAISLAEKELLKKANQETKVLRKKVLKKEMKNSKIIVEVFFAIEEDITNYETIKRNEE